MRAGFIWDQSRVEKLRTLEQLPAIQALYVALPFHEYRTVRFRALYAECSRFYYLGTSRVGSGLNEVNIPTSGPTMMPSRDRRNGVFEQRNRP